MKKLLLLSILFSSCMPSKKLKKVKYPTVNVISKNHVIISDSSFIYDVRLGN